MHFQGYGSHCSKWRHKRTDCRTRVAQQKNGALAGVQEPEAEGGGVESVQRSDVDSDIVELDSSSWCFTAMSTPRGPAGTLLVDSGADDHICHPGFAKESVKSTSPTTENGYENCIYSMNNINMSDEDNKHDTNYINKHKYTNHDMRKLHL